MKRQCRLFLESWFWVPNNFFVMCKYRLWVMVSFVTCQHRLIWLIIMFQAILSSILFEHIFEALITFIQQLLFQKWCYMERQGLLSLKWWLWFPYNSFDMCKYRLWVMFTSVACQHRLRTLIVMFQAILSSILFEHIVEALITIIQLLIFQKLVLHEKTMSFVSRIMILISK